MGSVHLIGPYLEELASSAIYNAKDNIQFSSKYVLDQDNLNLWWSFIYEGYIMLE